MLPFFFGDPTKQLLGVHHAPAVQPSRDIAVVLCYPIAHEYVATHRAYRVLAGRLAQVGFHVLRFDYYATGDSAGDLGEADLHQWMRDVHVAADELRASHGVLRIALAGLRVGGTLAALVAAERTDIEGVVLWHPVVSGRTYLEESRAQHRSWLTAETEFRPSVAARAGDQEIFGSPLPEALVRSLEGVDLGRIDAAPAREVLIISEEEEAAASALSARLTGLGATVDHRRATAWPASPRDALLALTHVPSQSVDAIVTWLSGVSV